MAHRRLFGEAYAEVFGPMFAVFCAVIGFSGFVMLAFVAAELVRSGELVQLWWVIGAAIWVVGLMLSLGWLALKISRSAKRYRDKIPD